MSGGGIDIGVIVRFSSPEQSVEDAGVPVNFLNGQYRQEGCPRLICCGDEFFDISIQLSSLSLQGLFLSWEEQLPVGVPGRMLEVKF